MARAVARMIIGFMLAAVVCLAVSPLVWTAGAQPQIDAGRVLAATTFSLFPAVTAPPATTTPPTVSHATTTGRPPTSSRPRATVAPGTTTSTSSTSVAPTTVASIPGVAPAPVTLPLAVGRQSGHVSAVFPILGGIGIIALIALLATQWFLTEPGRRGPTL